MLSNCRSESLRVLPPFLSLATGVGSNPLRARSGSVELNCIPFGFVHRLPVTHMPERVPSEAVGVGNKSQSFTSRASPTLPSTPLRVILRGMPVRVRTYASSIPTIAPVVASDATGVGSKSIPLSEPGDDPDPVASVRCTDTASRNNERLDGISLSFEILADGVENESSLFDSRNGRILRACNGRRCHVNDLTGQYHTGDASNIFTNDPSRSDLSYDRKHVRPEVTVIVRPASFAGNGKRLAGESAREHVDTPSVAAKVGFRNVFITCCFREMIVENMLAERIVVAMEYVFIARPLRRKIESADAGEKRSMCQFQPVHNRQ